MPPRSLLSPPVGVGPSLLALLVTVTLAVPSLGRAQAAGAATPLAAARSPAAPSGAPLELPFEQLPDYWLAQPTTVSLAATPLPCQAGSLTTRYTIAADGSISDPTVVTSTLDMPHQAEAVTWITQSRYAPAPGNAGHQAVRVSQQLNVSCG